MRSTVAALAAAGSPKTGCSITGSFEVSTRGVSAAARCGTEGCRVPASHGAAHGRRRSCQTEAAEELVGHAPARRRGMSLHCSLTEGGGSSKFSEEAPHVPWGLPAQRRLVLVSAAAWIFIGIRMAAALGGSCSQRRPTRRSASCWKMAVVEADGRMFDVWSIASRYSH